MTSKDLKTLASRELDDLPPMSSVVSDVLAEGARRQRRRRTAGVGLAAASIVGVVAVGTSVLPGLVGSDSPTPSQTPGVASATTGASDGPLTSTKAEFDAWAAQRFAAALPQRFSDVRPAGRHYSFVAAVDGRQIRFTINITQTDWEKSDLDPSDIDLAPSCESVAPAGCAELPSQKAIAYHETTDDGYAYAGMEMYLDDRSPAADEIALNFVDKASQGPVPIGNEELLTLVESQEFEQIWREYTAHPDWVYRSQIIAGGTGSPGSTGR